MIANLTEKLLNKLRRKDYRDAYVAENVKSGVAFQVRAMRDARGWSQKHLAGLMGKPQSVVSRIEDPDYGKLSAQTLLEVACAFDVALLIQFVGYGEFLQRTNDVSPEALDAPSFDASALIQSDFYRTEYITGQTQVFYWTPKEIVDPVFTPLAMPIPPSLRSYSRTIN